MIRSMTGYGSAVVTSDDGTATVEARSVNSRGLKVVVKGPPGIEAIEADLRSVVEGRVRRGRVDVFVRLGDREDSGAIRTLDTGRVAELLDGFERLRDEFGVPGSVDLATLSRFGGLFVESPRDLDPTGLLEPLSRALGEALDGLVEMREREGERLEEDLRERLSGLAAGLEASERLAPERLERERERLLAAVAELTDRNFDDDRLAREIALLADRWDVGEELVRARSHLAAFAEYLAEPAAEPVGKRLGFLVQELQREVNTLGAKANDTRITAHVVEMKNEIEKLREQIENVE
ncbi:MAG: YicC/YloC family endoribonuclease [Gemmatimonadota bacterium]|nr:YicC/YloC family endoribonuclease [Gemmatimonadota bacterium]